MGNALAHRGPDDEGVWIQPEAGIGLVNRRLAIIDLEGGRQPITNEDASIVTVFNGEIYNYRELRDELTGKGHRFVTQSDTEVIVHLYEESEAEFAARLRGMFAIAIWDDRRRQLVLVRDRVGKKPLYYSRAGGDFHFASEIKALTAAAPQGLEIDYQSLADYLAWTVVPAPGTIYRRIRSVEPGHVMIVRDRAVHESRRYWRLTLRPKASVAEADAIDQIDTVLRRAVRLRLRSDVPVGVFLSGGIDSGIVTAMAAQESSGAITTISVGFEDHAFDERSEARWVAGQYATDHHEVTVRPDAVNVLPKIAAAYDQPFADSSAVPSFYVAAAARPLVKVVLTGDGGDEVFAGYRRYVAARLGGQLRSVDGRTWRPMWRGLCRCLPAPQSFRTRYAFAHRFLRGLGMEPTDRYLAWAIDGFTIDSLRRLSRSPDWLAAIQPASRIVHDAGADPVDAMLANDFGTVLPADLLVKMDIATMAHGLEARSPLLDHELIDLVSRYPASLKLGGRQTKPLLRKLALRYLPETICTAPKRGFEIPRLRWLREDLRSMRDDIILSRTGLLADLFDRDHLERFLALPPGLDPARWAGRVWTLLMLGLWDRTARQACCEPSHPR